MNSQSMDKGAPVREDPIRDRYYRPWEISETVSTWLFWIAAGLSFAALYVDRATYPRGYGFVLVVFVVVVAAFFVAGLANRLYFAPRAEEARRQEFVSNAYGISLTHERTVGYYNNEEKEPDKRLALCVLENAFFTKAVLRSMAPWVRLRTAAYLGLWIAAAAWRDTPLDWIVISAQVLFSEELLSKWLRLEWYRMKAEATYSTTSKVLRSAPAPDRLKAIAAEAFANYESVKSVAGVLLSKDSFEKENAGLTAEWDHVRASLAK